MFNFAPEKESAEKRSISRLYIKNIVTP